MTALACPRKESLAASSNTAPLPSSNYRGLKLGLWAQDDIAHDTSLPKAQNSPTSFTVGHNVVRREEVDEVIELARRAGADIVKPPEDTFYGGYAGYFCDPNGHLWEVVWNPANLPVN